MEATDLDPGTDPRRRRRLALIGTLVTVALIVGGVLWLSRDRGMSIGDRRAVADLTGSRSVQVRVPAGVVEVTLARPAETARSGKETLRAPNGGRLIGVAWSTTLDLNIVREDSATVLEVVANGRRYPLADLHPARFEDRGRATLAVAGDGSDVAVEVTVAGQSQRVSSAGEIDKGRMASLYHVVGATSCQVPTSDRTFRANTRCWVGAVSRTPYLVDRGWAPPGRAWLTVSGHGVTMRQAVLKSPVGDSRVQLRPFAAAAGGAPTAGTSRAVGTPGPGVSADGGESLDYPDTVFEVPDDGALQVRLPMSFTAATRVEPSTRIPAQIRIDLTPTFTVVQR